ncbi:glycosyltransferase [Planktotalea arctica]|uniref:glycosyltransferase n=2 Tax=Planktotalea arctica TaxID=1481893 RepID=UPI00321A76BA
MSNARMRLVKPGAPLNRYVGKRPLGRLLVDRGLVSSSDLFATLGHQRSSDAPLGQLLLARGALSETAFYQTLAEQFGVLYVDPARMPYDADLQAGIQPHLALQRQTIPWARRGNVTLLATSAPEHFEAAAAALPARLHPASMVIANKSDIEAAICAQGNAALAERAEHLLPENLSCRSLPSQIKTLIALLLPTLLIAIIFQWLSFAILYRTLFTFAFAMVCVGIAIKTSGALIQIFARKPILSARAPPPEKLPRVSILIPLHDESDVLDALLRRIGLLSYPKALLDVILVIEATDLPTRAHLETARLPTWMRVLIVPPGRITTKPRALNYALPFCQGDIVGIYDAEDAPDPEQVSDVVAAFHAAPEKMACVQCVLDFYNAKANALSRFFAIEYATWFRLVLPGVARMGFAIPLGGTSVFFRRSVLERLHGWDAHNVTEDADLGIRLARSGYHTMLINSVTMEEANNSPWPWIKQRSRWLKGYLITYFTHMRSPLRLLFELGTWKFLGFQAFFLSAISQYMLAPLIWSSLLLYFGAPNWMQSALPVELLGALWITFIAMWCISIAVYIVAVSGKAHRHLFPWTICMGPYLALGTLAIYKGAWELITRPFYWDKTSHGHSGDVSDQPASSDAASSLSRVTKATEI